ncbi:unnamed protein product [Oncorhynchus mykiss]|uniref:Immunoglobulin V-set domain-containing protein n=1 Tax=Oncorhynchus mykiss TaxID=8022 RepID=A0A060WTJ6_ONCMY|nr:unnamed protein product [Oncorhynchus mykiss]
MPHVVAAITDSLKAVLFGKFNNPCFKVVKAWSKLKMSLNSLSAIFSTSDEATYYCASTADIIKLIFFFHNAHCLKDITLYQQPVSDPETLCLYSVQYSLRLVQENSVSWLRAGSGESHPGVLYTPGNWSDNPETPSPTQSCVYSLSKNNLSPSHAGTYYCAVATCGEILFGKGTKLDVKGTFNEMGRSLVTLKLNYTAA